MYERDRQTHTHAHTHTHTHTHEHRMTAKAALNVSIARQKLMNFYLVKPLLHFSPNSPVNIKLKLKLKLSEKG